MNEKPLSSIANTQAFFSAGMKFLSLKNPAGVVMLRKAAEVNLKQTYLLIKNSKSKDAAYCLADSYWNSKDSFRAEIFAKLAEELGSKTAAPALLKKIDAIRDIENAGRDFMNRELQEEVKADEAARKLGEGILEFSPIVARK
jgi:hypothetical protein